MNLAAANPDRQVVFFAIGFETTAPANAMAVWLARKRGLTNFSVLVSHVLVPPAMRRSSGPGQSGPGVPGPGHVCTVMGQTEYEPIAAIISADRDHRLRAGRPARGRAPDRPAARGGPAEVENPTRRAVRREGNPASQRLIEDVFEVCDRKWRGVGLIPESGYRLRDEYRAFDAERRFEVDDIEIAGVAGVHQRADPPGVEEAARLPRVRQGMHAADAARRHDGLVRGRLRRLLRLRPALEPRPAFPGARLMQRSGRRRHPRPSSRVRRPGAAIFGTCPLPVRSTTRSCWATAAAAS